jgi:hypothetical protein
MMSINPDAHSTAELDLTQWGVLMARKGGVPKERVLNCMSTGEIARWFAERRSNASPPRRARKILNKASNRTALAPKHGGL